MSCWTEQIKVYCKTITDAVSSGGSKFVWSVCTFLPDKTVSHSIRQHRHENIKSQSYHKAVHRYVNVMLQMCVSEPTLTHWAALKWVIVTATATVTHCLTGSAGITVGWFRVPHATSRGSSPKYAVDSPKPGAWLNNIQKYISTSHTTCYLSDTNITWLISLRGGGFLKIIRNTNNFRSVRKTVAKTNY